MKETKQTIKPVDYEKVIAENKTTIESKQNVNLRIITIDLLKEEVNKFLNNDKVLKNFETYKKGKEKAYLFADLTDAEIDAKLDLLESEREKNAIIYLLQNNFRVVSDKEYKATMEKVEKRLKERENALKQHLTSDRITPEEEGVYTIAEDKNDMD